MWSALPLLALGWGVGPTIRCYHTRPAWKAAQCLADDFPQLHRSCLRGKAQPISRALTRKRNVLFLPASERTSHPCERIPQFQLLTDCHDAFAIWLVGGCFGFGTLAEIRRTSPAACMTLPTCASPTHASHSGRVPPKRRSAASPGSTSPWVVPSSKFRRSDQGQIRAPRRRALARRHKPRQTAAG